MLICEINWLNIKHCITDIFQCDMEEGEDDMKRITKCLQMAVSCMDIMAHSHKRGMSYSTEVSTLPVFYCCYVSLFI